ncbi:MAG: hypothetical protein HY525_05500 [Betaproteobacteria bacterium]|nr:hypothetical protein [Betaproteobacteria bacterium]
MSAEQDILTQTIDDTLQFVSYAAHRGIQLADDEIANVIEAKRAGGAITAAQEKAFWASASRISKAIAPVTIESLRSSTRTDLDGPASAAWAARSYRVRTALTLVALLLFQIYWLIGATVTTDISEIKGRLTVLASEDVRLATQSQPKKGDPNYQVKEAKIKSDQQEFNARLWKERISAETDFDVLKNWNLAKNLLLWQRTPETTGKTKISPAASGDPKSGSSQDYAVKKDDYFLWVFTPDNVVEFQTAQIALTALLKYILPILYGALGASAYIVRTLATEIREHTYSVGSNVRFQLRFYLGAMAGFAIAWFTSDTKSAEAAGILQPLSPLAVAFLAGYSVELLFSLLDRIVVALSSAEPVKAKS